MQKTTHVFNVTTGEYMHESLSILWGTGNISEALRVISLLSQILPKPFTIFSKGRPGFGKPSKNIAWDLVELLCGWSYTVISWYLWIDLPMQLPNLLPTQIKTSKNTHLPTNETQMILTAFIGFWVSRKLFCLFAQLLTWFGLLHERWKMATLDKGGNVDRYCWWKKSCTTWDV